MAPKCICVSGMDSVDVYRLVKLGKYLDGPLAIPLGANDPLFAGAQGLKLTVSIEVAPEGGVSSQRIEEKRMGFARIGAKL